MISKTFAIDAIKEERASGHILQEVVMDELQHIWISEITAILTYRVSAKWKNEDQMIHCFASSVYVNINENWRLAFHQQTPVKEALHIPETEKN